jgi:hypothetical protein
VIVANGPSLNGMDLSVLRHRIVIGMNKIFLGFRKFGFYPRYYVAVNEHVIQQAANQIRGMNCVKFISNRSSSLVPEDALTYHLNTMDPPGRFCSDIAEGVHEGWTVTYVALQIAYYLGFFEVVLIGLDHRFVYEGEPNETRRLDGADLNHFSPEYFGGGQLWHNPDLPRSEESYRIARDRFEQAGRCIVDATVDGACTVFDKADYLNQFGPSVAGVARKHLISGGTSA